MDQKKQDTPLKDVMLEEAIELIKKSGIVGPSMDDSGSRDILIEHKHEKKVWKNEGNR